MPMRKAVEGHSRHCAGLDRIADRWSLLVLLRPERGALRFSEFRRAEGDISQRLLSQTTRRLEEDGLAFREVHPTVPSQVHCSLTELRRSLLVPIRHPVAWAETASLRNPHGSRGLQEPTGAERINLRPSAAYPNRPDAALRRP